MAPLFGFSEEVFNSVRHIDRFSKEDFKHPSQSLKEIIFKHRLTDDVGITLTHKHMDIRDNEIIVGSYDPSNNKVVLTYRARTAEDDEDLMKTHVPFQFIFGADFGWMPVAFWDIRSEGSSVIKGKLERMLENPTFLSDISAELQSQLTEGIANYGVCLLFHALIQGHETGLLETTDTDERTQWFRVAASVPVDESFNAVSTIWHWNPELTEDDCVSVCHLDRWSHDHNSSHMRR